MTRIVLLKQLKAFTEDATKDLIMPTKMQEEDEEQKYRSPGVHLMRLPNSKAAMKKAPYILHQVITGKDGQNEGQECESMSVVRSIFCAYNEDEEEGAMMLLNMMERLRVALLKSCIVGDQFELDLQAGVETLIYPDDTAPFFNGEMVTTWKIPPIKREVPKLWE